MANASSSRANRRSTGGGYLELYVKEVLSHSRLGGGGERERCGGGGVGGGAVRDGNLCDERWGWQYGSGGPGAPPLGSQDGSAPSVDGRCHGTTGRTHSLNTTAQEKRAQAPGHTAVTHV